MGRYVVRYGATRALGIFSTRGNDRVGRMAKVIARTHRGLEAADVLCEATDEVATRLGDAPGGQILRELSADDANELVHLHARERKEFETCQKHVERLKLQMQLIDIEHLFGGERIVVYYLSEDRVDFRDLVKALASEFQTRIEMRQIGVRDEAKLLADYGDCGKPLCCNTHLSEMPPVSMKMAKVQKATLDPTKISGRCGRLKCCLRYEYDIYEELMKDMPPVGSEVVTTTGRARVLGQEILSQQLLVQMEDGRRIMIPLTDVVTVLKAGTGKRTREPFGPPQPEGDAPAEGRRDQRRDSRPPRGDGRGDRNQADRHSAPTSESEPAASDAPPAESTGERPAGEQPRPQRDQQRSGDRRPPQRGAYQQRDSQQRDPQQRGPQQRDGNRDANRGARQPREFAPELQPSADIPPATTTPPESMPRASDSEKPAELPPSAPPAPTPEPGAEDKST